MILGFMFHQRVIWTTAIFILASACVLNTACDKDLVSGRHFECTENAGCLDGWRCEPCVKGYGPVGVCVKIGDFAPAGCTTDLDAMQYDGHDWDARDFGDVPDSKLDPGIDVRHDQGTDPDSFMDIDLMLPTDANMDSVSADDGISPMDSGPDICVPHCDGKNCGNDLCGGKCGTCLDGKQCVAGTCSCVAEATKGCCGDAVCWFDSCGTQGSVVAQCTFGCVCEQDLPCFNPRCTDCVAQCDGRFCGEDGCGGSCGTCEIGTSCDVSVCRGSTDESCVGPADCLSQKCTENRCQPRTQCGFNSVNLSHVDCTDNLQACVFDPQKPEDRLTCQSVEVYYNYVIGHTDKHDDCLETASCTDSLGYLPCCRSGEFCGSIHDGSSNFGVACCVPGEMLDGQGGSSTYCYRSAAKSYSCRNDTDCPAGWRLKRCLGATSSALGSCAECTVDGDCTSGSPRCTSNHCVACISNGDCSGTTPYCKGNSCVECLGNTNCPVAKPTCTTSGICST